MVFTTQNNMGGLGEAIQGIGETLGQVLQKRSEEQRFQNIFNSQAQPEKGNYSTLQLAEIAKKNPQLASLLQKQESLGQKQSQQQQQQSMAYTKLNEPQLIQLNERIEGLETTDLELNSLDELFKGGNLPSSFTAAMFDVEGEGGMSKLAKSQLHEDAQRAVKIITSQIRGISKIFPGRILQSEIQNFMKTLPGLLNSEKGRETILRDMRIFNKMGQIQSKEILNQMEKAGGSGAIPYSTAQTRASEASKGQLQDLKEMYLNPNKRDFARAPDASLLRGERLIDDTTGEELESDGIQWVPIKNKDRR